MLGPLSAILVLGMNNAIFKSLAVIPLNRLVLQGMKVLGSELAAFSDCLPENCILMKRFSVSDSFITSLLRGVRICL